jgi:hypothetical protein
MAVAKPVSQFLHILSEAGEFTNSLFVPIGWYCNKVAGRTDVDTGSVWVGKLEIVFRCVHGGILLE